VPIPALAAAEAIFTAVALSTLQAVEHCSVGAVPVVPLCAAKLAPVLFRVSELAASVAPLVTYPSGSLPQVAVGQYCLKTALLPLPDCPATVVFHPDPLPVASATPKLVIVVFVVWAEPFKVTALSVGMAGVVENDSEPAVTENCVLSSAVAAAARAGVRHPKAANAANAATSRTTRPWRSGRQRCGPVEHGMEGIACLLSSGSTRLLYRKCGSSFVLSPYRPSRTPYREPNCACFGNQEFHLTAG
jgi:hypothetical protein